MLMSLALITNVKVTDVYYKYDGDEETMKGLVAEHGAVVTRCIPAKCHFRWLVKTTHLQRGGRWTDAEL